MIEGYKSVAQTADEWQVSRKTVIKYCKQGMVPLAEKNGYQWIIPIEARKPLLTRYAAVRMMYFLTVFSEGGKPNLMKTGLSRYQVDNSYPFLEEMGFITEMQEGDTLQDQLKGVYITTLGKELIDKENYDRRCKGQLEISGKLKISTGIINAELDGKYKKQR